MDKKAKKILMYYMDDIKRNFLSSEEIEYAKEHGAILDNLPVTDEEAIRFLSKNLDLVTIHDAANAFLYSLSTRNMEYRYILASYVYAASWLRFDRGKTDKVPSQLNRTFYIWVKYRGGGIWVSIGKPIYYLMEFADMDKRKPTDMDYNILKEIISIVSTMDERATGSKLCTKITERKIFPCNKSEVVGLVETLSICGILETPEHKGYIDGFTPPSLRDTKDMRQSLSYPLNWWRGIHGVNFDNLNRVFGLENKG